MVSFGVALGDCGAHCIWKCHGFGQDHVEKLGLQRRVQQPNRFVQCLPRTGDAGKGKPRNLRPA